MELSSRLRHHRRAFKGAGAFRCCHGNSRPRYVDLFEASADLDHLQSFIFFVFVRFRSLVKLIQLLHQAWRVLQCLIVFPQQGQNRLGRQSHVRVFLQHGHDDWEKFLADGDLDWSWIFFLYFYCVFFFSLIFWGEGGSEIVKFGVE